MMNSGTARVRATNGASNQANASTTSESESLLDLALSFRDSNNTPLDMYSDLVGCSVSDCGFDFENTESIWDLNWEGAIL